MLLLVLVVLLGRSVVPTSDPLQRVRVFTRNIEFDFVNWTLQAMWVKWTQFSLGSAQFLTPLQGKEVVLNYLVLTRQFLELEENIERIYSDPRVVDPQRETVALRSQRDRLAAYRSLLAPLAESVLQNQVSAMLAEQGLTLAGRPIPPVLYHVSAPPNALIVSPRQTIRQDANISISPDMSVEQITRLEDDVAHTLDVSTIVEGIGGIGLYPTMVMQTTDLNFLAEVVSHEWTHNYLTLRPLGLNYDTNPQLRTMNETTANITGKEIGRAVIARFYAEYLPPEAQPEPQSAPQTAAQPQPPPFRFNREMHKTRLMVDSLLAQGKVQEAEDYMESRRRFFWSNGYALRKLNQAYFAFHGAYADEAEGAAGADPVGEAVRSLRKKSPTLADFVNRMAGMWSYAQLQETLGAAK